MITCYNSIADRNKRPGIDGGIFISIIFLPVGANKRVGVDEGLSDAALVGVSGQNKYYCQITNDLMSPGH